MAKHYDYFTDPGHGWLKVKKSELVALGIADKISSYSYERGEWAYLEEDCDMGAFFNAKGWKGDTDFWLSGIIRGRNSAYKQSKIRGYARYSSEPYVKPKVGDIVRLINCVYPCAKLIDTNRILTRDGLTYRITPSMLGSAIPDWI